MLYIIIIGYILIFSLCCAAGVADESADRWRE